jgi:hypothetical protein
VIRRAARAYAAQLPASIAAAYSTALFSAAFLLTIWARTAGVL